MQNALLNMDLEENYRKVRHCGSGARLVVCLRREGFRSGGAATSMPTCPALGCMFW